MTENPRTHRPWRKYLKAAERREVARVENGMKAAKSRFETLRDRFNAIRLRAMKRAERAEKE